VDFKEDLPPDAVAEIASLLAKGFLRYWKSQRHRPQIASEEAVDSSASQSCHRTVVNTRDEVAKDFPRHWKSQQQRPRIASKEAVDSSASQSRHGTVVNARDEVEN
jgi:hypothetical protein